MVKSALVGALDCMENLALQVAHGRQAVKEATVIVDEKRAQLQELREHANTATYEQRRNGANPEVAINTALKEFHTANKHLVAANEKLQRLLRSQRVEDANAPYRRQLRSASVVGLGTTATATNMPEDLCQLVDDVALAVNAIVHTGVKLADGFPFMDPLKAIRKDTDIRDRIRASTPTRQAQQLKLILLFAEACDIHLVIVAAKAGLSGLHVISDLNPLGKHLVVLQRTKDTTTTDFWAGHWYHALLPFKRDTVEKQREVNLFLQY